MNYYKVKFLKNNQPQGRPYTYAFDGELSAGDKVELTDGKHGVVEGVADMKEVEKFGVDRIKEIVGKCVESESGLKIGDKVVMNDKYHVSDKNKGKVFTVRSEPQEVGGTLCIWLEGYSSCYAVDGLDKYEESANEAEPV